MAQELKAPFPWFGGKKAVASLVWSRLGNPDNFIEPFAGSLAVLLLRPDPPRIETVNDLDCYVSNLWRATQHDPEAVAAHADFPVSECDLHSRHRWLVLSDDAAAFRQRMRTDPDYYDAKAAGWWCWGLCCWIGSGWCDATKLDRNEGATPALAGSDGQGQDVVRLSQQTPAGQRTLTGVHAQGDTPASKVRIAAHNPGSYGKGVLPDGNRPQLADAYDIGRGVNATPPDGYDLPSGRADAPTARTCANGVLANASLGTCAARRAWLIDWFSRLRDRLRNVRVCCGDWSRVCSSESVTTRLGTTGVFLDAPYRPKLKGGKRNRCAKLYSQEGEADTVDRVIAWCREHGGHPLMRIAACCYEGEGYEALLDLGWKVVEWESAGGYGNLSEVGKKNRKRERIFFSPHCLTDRGLFDGISEDGSSWSNGVDAPAAEQPAPAVAPADPPAQPPAGKRKRAKKPAAAAPDAPPHAEPHPAASAEPPARWLPGDRVTALLTAHDPDAAAAWVAGEQEALTLGEPADLAEAEDVAGGAGPKTHAAVSRLLGEPAGVHLARRVVLIMREAGMLD